MLAYLSGPRERYDIERASRPLIATAGSLQPKELSAAHVLEAAYYIQTNFARSTASVRLSSLRTLLRYLWATHGAPKLDTLVPKGEALRPRNVTATDEEQERILKAAPDDLRLWLLLCSDLAIRSGTAANLTEQNYNRQSRTLRFTTKCSAHLTLPVTNEIAELLELCDDRPIPFTRQLWFKRSNWKPKIRRPQSEPARLSHAFLKLRRELGITRKLTAHDFRRTAAVHMLEATGDIRDVQALLGHRNLVSTIWYLDHDLRPVKRSTLELIKSPEWRKARTA